MKDDQSCIYQFHQIGNVLDPQNVARATLEYRRIRKIGGWLHVTRSGGGGQVTLNRLRRRAVASEFWWYIFLIFCSYGRVQSVKLLPRLKEEDGSTGLSATVAFMDIKSASKAHNMEHKLDERCLSTEYYEPAAIPGGSAAPIYAPPPRFPHGWVLPRAPPLLKSVLTMLPIYLIGSLSYSTSSVRINKRLLVFAALAPCRGNISSF